jgi:predicted PP-loop superfamily ATPase
MSKSNKTKLSPSYEKILRRVKQLKPPLETEEAVHATIKIYENYVKRFNLIETTSNKLNSSKSCGSTSVAALAKASSSCKQ